MRIGIVTPTEVGRTETFIRAHIERLPHDVVYFYGYGHDYRHEGERVGLPSGRPQHSWLNLLPRFLEFRLRKRFFPVPTKTDRAKDFLREGDFDVILAQYGTAAAFIAPLCRDLGIPLVAHFHGFDASRHEILRTFAAPYREMFAYASAIISVSTAMSEALIEAGCPSGKIVRNPCAPHPAFFEVGPDYGSDTIVAVGRHTAKKAPYLTLDAFRRAREQVPSLRLAMVGDGELFEVTERLVAAWGLEESVELVGAADPKVVRQVMARSFAFVQHSVQALDGDSEGTPVAILEAGAAGLPVVSTRHAGIPEVIEEGENGYLVEPGDSAAMSERIVSLARDRDRARDLGTKARLRVRKEYSMDHHLDILEQVLARAADNHPTKAPSATA